MKIPPQSTLSGFFDKKIQEFDEWIVEVFEPFFEFWPSVWHGVLPLPPPPTSRLTSDCLVFTAGKEKRDNAAMRCGDHDNMPIIIKDRILAIPKNSIATKIL